MSILNQFHFIRPEWFLATIPLALLCWALLRKKLYSNNWQSVIDPALLPHLLLGKPGTASRLPLVLFLSGGIIAIIALAGPVWEKLPQPVFKEQSALVLALDLSRSMDSADIKPSRLTRARHKITDILSLRKEGQTALIGYAAEAFVITPLTDDTATINLLVPGMNTDIMPAQGSRADLAVEKAAQLLLNAGIAKGDILLITDGISEKSAQDIKQQSDAGHRISVLAIGTTEGAPITLTNGGFLKDDNGSIVIPKLNPEHLRSIAMDAGGRFSSMTADDADIKHLLGLLDINRMKTESLETEMKADIWREEGPWLLLLLIPLAAYSFRKGYLSLLLFFMLPFPQPAEAFNWDELWLNDNQRAAQQFKLDKHSDAASLFNDQQWKASAHYKAGEYEQALQQFEQLDDSDAYYNRGNTLAKINRIDEAIAAYDQALKLSPNHEDALYNKEQLIKLKQQNDQNNKDDKNVDNKNSQQKDKNNQQKEDAASSQQNQQDKQQDGQSSDNQQDSQQKSTPESEPQQAENSDNNNETDNKSAQKNPAKENGEETEQQQQQLSQSEKEDESSKQATEQWLRRVPDDPGGLLRNKFKYLYQQQKNRNRESQTW